MQISLFQTDITSGSGYTCVLKDLLDYYVKWMLCKHFTLTSFLSYVLLPWLSIYLWFKSCTHFWLGCYFVYKTKVSWVFFRTAAHLCSLTCPCLKNVDIQKYIFMCVYICIHTSEKKHFYFVVDCSLHRADTNHEIHWIATLCSKLRTIGHVLCRNIWNLKGVSLPVHVVCVGF